jgi:hypothetical protein
MWKDDAQLGENPQETIQRVGICTGRAARTGVQPGWARARPRAEISPPERHPCPRLGLLRVYGFFFACIESPQRFPKCGSLSDCLALCHQHSAVFHQCFLHGDFRIVRSFTFSHLLLATFPHGDFWDFTRRHVWWVRQEVVYCYTACHRRTPGCPGGELGPTSCERRCIGDGGVVGCHLGRWINCLHLGLSR